MSLLLFLCDFTGLVTDFRQFRTEKRPVSAGRFRFDAKESQRFEQFGVRHFAPNGFRPASLSTGEPFDQRAFRPASLPTGEPSPVRGAAGYQDQKPAGVA